MEGRLAGDWVAEAENAWCSLSHKNQRVLVDMTGVTGVDACGRRLLEGMNREGAGFLVEGVAMKALIKEIQGAALSAKRKGSALVSLLGLWMALHGGLLYANNAPAAPLRLTLKDAVSIALRQNPQVAIANLNLAESAERRNVARSELLPQVSLRASDQVTRGNVEALLGRKIPGFPAHVGPFWTIQAGPGFSAPLFDLTLWNRFKAARELMNGSDADRTTARELNVQLVVSQYLGSLRASADVSAARSRLDLAKALFDLASDLEKNGVGTGIDTLRANVQYQNERQRYTEAEAQRKISLYGLTRLLNIDPGQPVELADEPSFFQTPTFNAGESLAEAYQQRPEMKSILSQIRAAEYRMKAAKDERLPRLSVSGGWSLQGITPDRMIPAYQYGASLEMPLFTGGRIQAEAAIADVEIRKLEQSEQEVRNIIALEVKTATAQLESARTEVEAANAGVNLARESVTQAQDRFKAGVANNIEVITAQDELARANDNQIRALYRYNQARADLARATGRMEALYSK